MIFLPLGPLMVDVEGIRLTERERQRLLDPRVGGVILFSRNYQDRAQLSALCAEIHALRSPRLLLAVDHEGGRVQRFREGFTRLPAMRLLGKEYEQNPGRAERLAEATGFILAAELKVCGVDFSFTPVLDLDYGPSRVIGDRAFHRDPKVVTALASALSRGLSAAGMGNCGKHFPGHGYVVPDSHLELPIDDRPLQEMDQDLLPYRELVGRGEMDAVMAAHVIYSDFCEKTAVFSRKWNDYLRKNIKFDGVVFTDDLSMAGAGVVGDVLKRVEAAYNAGCDMLLVCNDPLAVEQVLAQWFPAPDALRSQRIEKLIQPSGIHLGWEEMLADARYQEAHMLLAPLLAAPLPVAKQG